MLGALSKTYADENLRLMAAGLQRLEHPHRDQPMPSHNRLNEVLFSGSGARWTKGADFQAMASG